MNKTKIIATIRDTYSEEKLLAIHQAGVNIVRFNFSHAQPEAVEPLVKRIHQLNAEGTTNLGILLDTKGPEVRTGAREETYEYQTGEQFRIFIDSAKLEKPSDLLSDYPYLLEDLKPWDTIAIESGLMSVVVKEVHTDYLLVESQNHCSIGSRRHMNFPGIKLRLPGLTEKDKKDLKFWIENGINYIAASFIRNVGNIEEIRAFLKENNAEHIKIISKIENQEGLDNIEEIVKKSDAIMIARGDLGIEIPIETLPYYQDMILDICSAYGKPCIMATELLKSMVHSPFPTRAEVSDVYHAVTGGASAVMLSDETAAGEYPVESVTIMRKTVTEAEKHMHNEHEDFEVYPYNEEKEDKRLLFRNALSLADDRELRAIVVCSHSDENALLLAGNRPNQEVFYFVDSDQVYHELHHLYGIHGMQITFGENVEEDAIKTLIDSEHLSSGEKILIIRDGEEMSNSPLIKIVTVK